MLIVAVGVNHRTAPVEIREKLSFLPHSLPANLKKLHHYPGIEGCAIISTCNRTEIYAVPRELDEGLHAIWNFLSEYSGLDISEIKNCTFCHTLYDSIRHLFRVSAGLDSMILGETQILGQVREAYEVALKAGTTNNVINTLFQQAIVVGKRVRTETGIDKNAVSVSYAAVELAKQKFGELNGRSVLVVGAGKMSELTAKHLVSNGVSGVIVSNRSFDRAEMLAEKFNGKAVKFEELSSHMKGADIVISSTAASHYVIRYPDIQELLNDNPGKKVMLIDIAVPRDIDPRIGELPGVSLYDIDDLQSVVDNNLAERRQAAVASESIIEDELNEFMRWLATQFVVPTIAALKKMGEEIKQKELERALNRLGDVSDRQYKVISSMANSIVKQLLHFPVVRLKEYAVTTEGHLYTEVLQNLFDLEVDGQRPKKKEPPKQIDLSAWVSEEEYYRSKGQNGGASLEKNY
ncbi:glutamyl-tRNA reductase [Desulfofalx alkaliphila]|uniref:glutamyl-tRNA reductase n=1 Tax=Desulfofalx alkaliphila TaxID=105483 RepID=UPI000552FBFD|nr:glutamyl-tRNA reductase [Desulfofalx alkaliphila]